METVASERYSHAHCEPNTLRNLLIIFRGDFNIILGSANHKVEDPPQPPTIVVGTTASGLNKRIKNKATDRPTDQLTNQQTRRWSLLLYMYKKSMLII